MNLCQDLVEEAGVWVGLCSDFCRRGYDVVLNHAPNMTRS